MVPARLTRALIVLIVPVVLAASGTGARAEERTKRRYDMIGGFRTAAIFSLAQDREGFIWTGIEGGGLARFDGREFIRWAPNKLTSHVLFGKGAGEDLVLIVEPRAGEPGGNTLHRIAGKDVEPIAGPGGQPWAGVRDAVYDQRQRLWVARQTELFYRSHSDAWIQISFPLLARDRIRRLASNRRGGVFVVTTAGVVSVDDTGEPLRIVESPWAADVLDRGDGSILFVEKKPLGGAISLLRNGTRTELLFRPANFVSFVLRGRTAWAAFDNGAVALRPGEGPEVLGPAQGLPGGGSLVDFEGSLWVGTTSGLVQVAEPETALWDESDGLPIASSRYLASTDEGVWVSTWAGMCRLTQVGGVWSVVREENQDHKWPLVTDGRGRLWGKHRDEFLERVAGRFKRYLVPDSGVLLSSARASDGTLWMGTERGLFKTTSSGAPPVPLARPPDVDQVEQVFEDSRGQLWVSAGSHVYHAMATDVASARPVAWARTEIPGAGQLSKIIETSSGAIWAATSLHGVWRFHSGAWAPLPASRRLQTPAIYNLVPSRSGGLWILSTGTSIRVTERPDSDDGWEVVEEISGWQGLPPTGISDLIEESDGTLWFATAAGVVRIRPEARRANPLPPPIRHTAFIVNGNQLEPGPAAQLVSDGDQIELHFAALSYRSPGLLRYEYRLHTDGPWVGSNSREPVFRFLDLRPGRYSAEVRASLDGAAWSVTPARVDFEVLGPWYWQWWALSGFLLAIVAILTAAHRARVAVLLRLERQRAAIARDLHDEIGSGLGSIGILAGVVASDNVEEGQRRKLVGDIVETAAEMGSALTDIVWSLRSDSATLEGLATRLTQRGGRLFPEGGPTFTTEFPETWPTSKLALSVQHNLFLIASEALHNAARHSQARLVVLGMAPHRRGWVLSVADDGRGMGEDGEPIDPLRFGLASMRERAEAIGAQITWSSGPTRGTRVTVTFTLDGHARR